MAKPENVIIQESDSRFHGQPAWTEDMYDNFVLRKKAGSTTVDYMRVTAEFRSRHNFPEDVSGLVLRTTFDEQGGDPVTGETMGQEAFEGFLQAVEGRPARVDKNNWVLIEDIVDAMCKSGLTNIENGEADFLFDTVREAVYRRFPENGPDPVWLDAIINRLVETGAVSPGYDRTKLEREFTQTFRDFVYGYHPRPAESG